MVFIPFCLVLLSHLPSYFFYIFYLVDFVLLLALFGIWNVACQAACAFVQPLFFFSQMLFLDQHLCFVNKRRSYVRPWKRQQFPSPNFLLVLLTLCSFGHSSTTIILFFPFISGFQFHVLWQSLPYIPPHWGWQHLIVTFQYASVSMATPKSQ